MEVPEIPNEQTPPPIDESDKDSNPSQPQTFKCKSCGGKMEFAPGSESQECPYCGHTNEIPKSEEDIEELDYHAILQGLEAEEDTIEQLTVNCPQCAAEFSTEPNVTSQECPFCGSTVVATATSTKHLKPRSLLPFKVTRKEGHDSFAKWIKKLWFAPNKIKRSVGTQDRLNGMYVPYWTYDTDTTTFYTGMKGIHYYETQRYTTTENGKTVTKTRQVQKTRWYPASGTVWRGFDDVLILASESLPRKYTRKLEPWDLEELVPYKDAYLSGFKSESYKVGLEPGFDIAKERMDGPIRDSIRRDIGGDTQQIHTVKTQHNNVTFKHILLPIWISAYRYKNKVYRFLINARTGEVQGERPWSAWKITLAVLAGLIVIGGIVFLFQTSK